MSGAASISVNMIRRSRRTVKREFVPRQVYLHMRREFTYRPRPEGNAEEVGRTHDGLGSRAAEVVEVASI